MPLYTIDFLYYSTNANRFFMRHTCVINILSVSSVSFYVVQLFHDNGKLTDQPYFSMFQTLVFSYRDEDFYIKYEQHI